MKLKYGVNTDTCSEELTAGGTTPRGCASWSTQKACAASTSFRPATHVSRISVFIGKLNRSKVCVPVPVRCSFKQVSVTPRPKGPARQGSTHHAPATPNLWHFTSPCLRVVAKCWRQYRAWVVRMRVPEVRGVLVMSCTRYEGTPPAISTFSPAERCLASISSALQPAPKLVSTPPTLVSPGRALL